MIGVFASLIALFSSSSRCPHPSRMANTTGATGPDGFVSPGILVGIEVWIILFSWTYKYKITSSKDSPCFSVEFRQLLWMQFWVSFSDSS